MSISTARCAAPNLPAPIRVRSPTSVPAALSTPTNSVRSGTVGTPVWKQRRHSPVWRVSKRTPARGRDAVRPIPNRSRPCQPSRPHRPLRRKAANRTQAAILPIHRGKRRETPSLHRNPRKRSHPHPWPDGALLPSVTSDCKQVKSDTFPRLWRGKAFP